MSRKYGPSVVFQTIILVHISFLSFSPVSAKQPFDNGPEEMPQSTCVIKNSRSIIPCLRTYENIAAGYVLQTFNGTEGTWNGFTKYSNISIQFPSGVNGIIEIREITDSERGILVNQYIDLRHNLFVHSPIEVVLEFLPTDLDDLQVDILVPFNRHYNSDDPCLTATAAELCEKLSNIQIAMKPKQDSLQFSTSGDCKWPLTIHLYRSLDDLNCDQLFTSTTYMFSTHQWLYPEKEIVINNLTSANYCARAVHSELDVDCCSIFTETVSLQTAFPVEWTPHSPNEFYISPFSNCLIAILALLVGLTVLIYITSLKGIIKSRHKWDGKISIRRDHESKVLVVQTRVTEIFLVYPKGNAEFMNMMRSFRKFLSEHAGKVWDPHKGDEQENVAANPARWMYNVLRTPNLKIVIVEPEDVVGSHQSEDRAAYNDAEDLYFSVFSYVINNPSLVFNYQRLFIVRFDTMRNETSTNMMVSQKRYKMPYQLGLLITDMSNPSHVSVLVGNSSSLETLTSRIQDYQEMMFTKRQEKCTT